MEAQGEAARTRYVTSPIGSGCPKVTCLLTEFLLPTSDHALSLVVRGLRPARNIIFEHTIATMLDMPAVPGPVRPSATRLASTWDRTNLKASHKDKRHQVISSTSSNYSLARSQISTRYTGASKCTHVAPTYSHAGCTFPDVVHVPTTSDALGKMQAMDVASPGTRKSSVTKFHRRQSRICGVL